MPALTEDGPRLVSETAARHGVSTEAAEHLLYALAAGQGTQAQFNHPELGGMGQWSLGGMTMVGDMFNNALKAKVDALCSELAQGLAGGGVFRPQPQRPVPPQGQSQSQSSGQSSGASRNQSQGPGSSLFLPGGAGAATSWPGVLGAASSVGSQNNLRYAVFPDTRRLAIDIGGAVEIYDTGDHRITGVSQQQSGDQSLTFTSQHGLVRLSDLPKVGTDPAPTSGTAQADPVVETPAPSAPPPQPVSEPPAQQTAAPAMQSVPMSPAPSAMDADAVIGLIRKLGELMEAGLLTREEFEAKKRDLLDRL